MMNFKAIADRSFHRRAGFTLVELLVAMSILVVLATLTVSGFRSTQDADRVGEAASTLRAALEGARSRAIRFEEKRGIRLLLDPTDKRRVTSVVQLVEGEEIRGKLRFEFDYDESGDTDSMGKWRVIQQAPKPGEREDFIRWKDLQDKGYLRAGTTISVGNDTFTIQRFSASGAGDGGVALVLNEAYLKAENTSGDWVPKDADPDDVSSPGTFGLDGSVASRAVPYSLKLAPTPLEGAAPVTFPVNTCIDLDGSNVPDTWRPSRNGTGALGSSAGTYGPENKASVNSPLAMDIMFTQRGVVDRELVGEGFLQFRMAHVQDVLDARDRVPDFWTIIPTCVQNPKYPAKVVTLVTQSGMMRVSGVDGEDCSPLKLDPSNDAETPSYNNHTLSLSEAYRRAKLGREASR